VKGLFLSGIRFYQRTFSVGLGTACRYQPSCSEFGYEAIERYGAVKGSWLLVRRLARCHPFHSPGFDPVP
jgi:putative membrane protein insertion efficiency factor